MYEKNLKKSLEPIFLIWFEQRNFKQRRMAVFVKSKVDYYKVTFSITIFDS